MAEIKNSAILDRVLDRAKEVDQKIKPVITAERFLVALVDELHNVEGVYKMRYDPVKRL